MAFLWITEAELANIPMSGADWTDMLGTADAAWPTADMTDQGSNSNIYCMAGALVFARTSTESYRTKVDSYLQDLVDANTPSYDKSNPSVLGWGRNIGAFVIAADLIDLENHNPTLYTDFVTLITGALTESYSGEGMNNLVHGAKTRPGYLGDWCRFSATIISAYIGDGTTLDDMVDHFKYKLGDRTALVSDPFSWAPDASWQEDPVDSSTYRGIVSEGVVRDLHNFDGIMPDDMRRNAAYLKGTFNGDGTDTSADLGASGPAYGIAGTTLFFTDEGNDSRDLSAYNPTTKLAEWITPKAPVPQGGDTWTVFPGIPSTRFSEESLGAIYGTLVVLKKIGQVSPEQWSDAAAGRATTRVKYFADTFSGIGWLYFTTIHESSKPLVNFFYDYGYPETRALSQLAGGGFGYSFTYFTHLGRTPLVAVSDGVVLEEDIETYTVIGQSPDTVSMGDLSGYVGQPEILEGSLTDGIDAGGHLHTLTTFHDPPDSAVLGDVSGYVGQPEALEGSVVDGVETGEDLTTRTTSYDSIEAVHLGDTPTHVDTPDIAISDGVGFGDGSVGRQTAFLQEADGVSLGDSLSTLEDLTVQEEDGSVFGDSASAVLDSEISQYLISPDAVRGAYVTQDTTEPWEITITGYFSRLDLYAGVGTDGTTNGGVIDFEVEVWNGFTWDPYITGDVSTYRELEGNETENLSFFYNSVLNSDGTNASVFTLFHLPFDQYRVILSPGGLDPADLGIEASYRINGIGTYYLDPEANMLPAEFATDTNVFSMLPESGHEDLRNHVIVVGSRKGVVTDSAKFSGEQTNPNNLEPEFHVQVASDPNSIYNPNATNFTGNRRVAVIYDEKVSDSDFSRWLALTALYRYRNPQHKVPVETVGVPMLEVGDSIQVYEARHQMVNRVVRVQGFSEKWSAQEGSTSITTSSYPEVPAYRPRENLDIDALFGGSPAINVELGYTNIFGTPVSNTDLDSPDIRNVLSASEVMTSAFSQALTAVALPETIILQATSGDITNTQHRAVINHPYRHFWHINGWNGNHYPTLDFDIQEGDGATGLIYNSTYYKMPADAPLTWNIKYNTFFSRNGENPFYDPYSSELGHLVSVGFDALISGRYRVSVWDARKSGGLETPVAWLTNPEGDPMDAAAHWLYMEPQSNVEFLWDGVDNIGIWNRLQSAHYAERVAGAFGQEAVAAGEGFYAWNDSSTDLLTQIGDDVSENYRSGGDIRESGYPFFTLGKYGKFYVKIEVWNDEIASERATVDDRTSVPLRLETTNLDSTFNSTEEAYIWTHLGEPNQIDISIDEWNADKLGAGNPGEYTQGTQADGWEKLGVSDPATLRNGKPVRISFSPRPRPGVLFGENSDFTSARLTRQVHLQTTVFDQFWTFFNTTWDGIHYNNDSVLQKRLTSRMFHNNDHTLEWADSGFRTGGEISAYNWVFEPRLFKKDFGKGYEEPLEYGSYEQLEALPGHQERRLGGGNQEEEAYINSAFMNYLFYFSAHSLDRSGRRQWMLNREFVDKSKIVTPDWLAATYGTNPEYAVNHEDRGADLYLKRTIFTREWLDPHWASGGSRTPLSPVNANHLGTSGITDPFELEWVQFPVSYLDLESSELTDDLAPAHEDLFLEAYITDSTTVNAEIRKNNGSGGADRTRRTLSDISNHYVLPGGFGNWDFVRGPQALEWYKPSPKVDFHPYWTQTMPNWMVPHTNYYVQNDPSSNYTNGKLPGFSVPQVGRLSYTGLLAIPSSHIVEKLRDPKGQENWFGFGFQSGIGGSGNRGIRLEQSVAGWATNEVQADLNIAFDYVRQDQLNRYEHFRGLWGRGRYEYRDDTYANYANYDQPRYGPRQNVKASGVYFMNLGRYTDFVTGPAHRKHRQEYQHYTRGISDWYYMRFRHEYVWYHDRHFPVSGRGTSRYDLFRSEYTKPQDTVVFGWYLVAADASTSKVYYDPGAWVGWKDDIPLSGPTKWVEGWDTAPVLRWGDAAYRGLGAVWQGSEIPWDPNGGDDGKEFSSGGFNYGTNTWQNTSYEDLPLSPEALPPLPKYIRRNIFDNATGDYGLFTLAVGPELSESREINMNLVLPTNLVV